MPKNACSIVVPIDEDDKKGRQIKKRQEAEKNGGRKCTDSLPHKLAQKSTGLLPSLWRGQEEEENQSESGA
jgi:hypothetical protein